MRLFSSTPISSPGAASHVASNEISEGGLFPDVYMNKGDRAIEHIQCAFEGENRTQSPSTAKREKLAANKHESPRRPSETFTRQIKTVHRPSNRRSLVLIKQPTKKNPPKKPPKRKLSISITIPALTQHRSNDHRARSASLKLGTRGISSAPSQSDR